MPMENPFWVINNKNKKTLVVEDLYFKKFNNKLKIKAIGFVV
jgi:hypothetical protein